MPDPNDGSAAALLGDAALSQLLLKSSLFANLDEPGRHRLLESASVENYSPGQVVMTEGEPGDSFFFIKTGAVEVSTSKEGKKLKLADLAAGDFFGEVSVLTNQPRTATVTALSPVVTLKFQRKRISRILMDYPEVTRTLNAKIEDRAADTIKKMLE